MESTSDKPTSAKPLFVDTPESALAFNPAVEAQCIDDVMLCALHRNAAVVDILLADIIEKDHFGVPIHVVRNLLWLLQGQFAQMKIIMRDYRKPQETD